MVKTPNERQRFVINNLTDNVILFASAGTGKTFTVANRVANIIALGKALPEEILCLTFTIKAANEMKEDIVGYVGKNGEEVRVNTIHGFCYQLIIEESKRKGERYSDLCVVDEVDQEELLKSIFSSRFYSWKLERTLKDAGVSPSSLDNCPLCQIDGSEEIFWIYGNKLVDGKGNYQDIPKDARILPATVRCPACGRTNELKSGRCIACGKEFSFSFERKNFEIFNRKIALRNIVSEIKHIREDRKLYSENPVEDYQSALQYLKENKQKKYEELFSYYAKYIGYTPDEDFISATDSFLGEWIAEYDEYLRLSNLLDFDDLILQAYSILQSEDGYAYWSTKFKYITVDEMQDTSLLEYELLKKLFAQNNVLLCGDLFQTIYAWRGSSPTRILEDYATRFSAKTYMLSQNYRATKILAEATFGYLKNCYPQWIGRYCPKNLEIQSETEGEPIFCYAFDNREEEARQIYRYLLRNQDENPSNTCIIARANRYIAELYRYFEQFNEEREGKEQLQFFTVEENFQFFKKPLVKDILAVLKLLLNPHDRVSMERLSEKFVRQVGIKTIEKLRGYNYLGVSLPTFVEEGTHEYGDPYYHLISAYQTGNIVVYDTETTGLNLEKDEIIQLAAIKIDEEGNILDRMEIFIEPTIPISDAAYQTHGFDLHYIQERGGTTAKEGLTKFLNFSKGCVLVGHNNLAYDRPLIDRQLRENDLPPLESIAEYDTLLLAKQFYPSSFNFKLSTLCQLFSVVNERAHDALADITATGKCLVELLKRNIIPTETERREILSKHVEKFEKFYSFMQRLRQRLEKDEELTSFIVDELLLRKRYPTRKDADTIQDLIDNLKPTENYSFYLKEFLKDAALSGSQMDKLIAKTNKIPIITAHQAKGCEFQTVIIAGADDGNFPSYAAKQSGEEEEEKKVFYVAMTRAKKKLILTRALHNGKYTIDETPYFWYIPEEFVRVNKAWKNGN